MTVFTAKREGEKVDKLKKTINYIEYGKDLLQNRPEQDTVDYKLYDILNDALEQLKEQKKLLEKKQHDIDKMCREYDEQRHRINDSNIAQVLTIKEINALSEGQFVWIQFKDGLYCMQIIGVVHDINGNIDFIQLNTFFTFIEIRIRDGGFVLWSGQPTEEQMEAMKWDGDQE